MAYLGHVLMENRHACSSMQVDLRDTEVGR
jgi:hypothetical protein